jgi:phosphatidyl-myo-inositol dimannoside synthase
MPYETASDLRHIDPDESGYGTSQRVVLLSPSQGLGGGIERYIGTLEWAFADRKISWQRINLDRPGLRAHLKMLADGRAVLGANKRRTRLVVGHQTLMPVAMLLARESMVSGISVLCYGRDAWNDRNRPRSSLERFLMRRPGVRVVAISNFTAGALARDCPSTILRPALSQEWFETLVVASAAVQRPAKGVQLATAFRLADWRNKGLPQLIESVTALRRSDVRLTICGSGEPPPDLLRLVGNHDWCTLRVGLTDHELAIQLASADIFVLATRTRIGRQANGEGFGLVLLEAQVAGTPVVAPAHGGSSDAYMDGVTGVGPVDESSDALAGAISGLLEDPSRLALMRKHAARWARESFAPESYPRLVASKLL